MLSYVSVSVPSCDGDTKLTVAYEYSHTNVHQEKKTDGVLPLSLIPVEN